MTVDSGDPGSYPWVGIKVYTKRKIEKETVFWFYLPGSFILFHVVDASDVIHTKKKKKWCPTNPDVMSLDLKLICFEYLKNNTEIKRDADLGTSIQTIIC